VLEVCVRRKQGSFSIDASFRSKVLGITALFGSSGAGKTSIINMVAGLARPDEGRICINGRELFDSEKGIDLPPEKRRIGYVFQEGRLFPHLSVRSNLCFGMHRTNSSDRYVDFDQIVQLLAIEHLLCRRPAGLSGGEKQRVAIGRALLTSPAMLLMDEPLASLDHARKAEVLPFIATLSREFSIPILYVSHSMNEILNLADDIVVLDSGRTVVAGSFDELISMQKNTFSGIIEQIADNNGSLPDVRLNIGCPLLARITPGAGNELGLRLGRKVFVPIKRA